MMTYLEISKKIDKSIDTEGYIDYDIFAEEFQINRLYGFYVEQERLKSYFISNWNDTDTTVGTKMYFLDNVPVCISNRLYRKSDEDIYWFGKDQFNSVKAYCESLIDDLQYNVIDITTPTPDTYCIDYKDQLIKDTCLIDGVTTNIDKCYNLGMSSFIEYTDNNGNIQTIPLNNVKFKINIIEE